MKILQVHNKYIYKGGEDVVLEAEKKLLEKRGHKVIQYIRDNSEIKDYNIVQKSALLNTTSWSRISYDEISAIIKNENPDLCHVHNYLPLISPSVFYACKDENVPVVQTLHNYRMLCSNAYLFRNGKVCEDCIGQSLFNSVKHGCYRDSKIQTFALAKMIEKHKQKGTWQNMVDAYICLTDFAKHKFVEGGLPEEKLFVKPNFVEPSPSNGHKNGNYFFFIGRLESAKGIDVAIEAFKNLNDIELIVAGDGPLKERVNGNLTNLNSLGYLNKKEIQDLLNKSSALVFPSLWYEGMPMSIIEAFSSGKPVIASNHGAMAELIEDCKMGLLFEPGNAYDLKEKVLWANENKDQMKQMGINAQKVYKEKYTPDRNYEILMNIYEKAISKRDDLK